MSKHLISLTVFVLAWMTFGSIAPINAAVWTGAAGDGDWLLCLVGVYQLNCACGYGLFGHGWMCLEEPVLEVLDGPYPDRCLAGAQYLYHVPFAGRCVLPVPCDIHKLVILGNIIYLPGRHAHAGDVGLLELLSTTLLFLLREIPWRGPGLEANRSNQKVKNQGQGNYG